MKNDFSICFSGAFVCFCYVPHVTKYIRMRGKRIQSIVAMHCNAMGSTQFQFQKISRRPTRPIPFASSEKYENKIKCWEIYLHAVRLFVHL